jgi:hypothetical protein
MRTGGWRGEVSPGKVELASALSHSGKVGRCGGQRWPWWHSYTQWEGKEGDVTLKCRRATLGIAAHRGEAAAVVQRRCSAAPVNGPRSCEPDELCHAHGVLLDLLNGKEGGRSSLSHVIAHGKETGEGGGDLPVLIRSARDVVWTKGPCPIIGVLDSRDGHGPVRTVVVTWHVRRDVVCLSRLARPTTEAWWQFSSIGW